MTMPAFSPVSSYGNGFDRLRTLSSPEAGLTWFRDRKREAADTAARRK